MSYVCIESLTKTTYLIKLYLLVALLHMLPTNCICIHFPNILVCITFRVLYRYLLGIYEIRIRVTAFRDMSGHLISEIACLISSNTFEIFNQLATERCVGDFKSGHTRNWAAPAMVPLTFYISLRYQAISWNNSGWSPNFKKATPHYLKIRFPLQICN